MKSRILVIEILIALVFAPICSVSSHYDSAIKRDIQQPSSRKSNKWRRSSQLPIQTATPEDQISSIEAQIITNEAQYISNSPAHNTKFVAECEMPTIFGQFKMRAYSYSSPTQTLEPIVMISGDISKENVIVRVHDQCFSSEIFGSRRCDCREQLHESLRLIKREGGIVIYLQQEGRGIGASNKVAAYALQDKGLDTVDANLHLGFNEEMREYTAVPDILRDIGIDSIRLVTNNPFKMEQLQKLGVRIVSRVNLPAFINPYNVRYMRSKRDRMSHILPDIQEEYILGAAQDDSWSIPAAQSNDTPSASPIASTQDRLWTVPIIPSNSTPSANPSVSKQEDSWSMPVTQSDFTPSGTSTVTAQDDLWSLPIDQLPSSTNTNPTASTKGEAWPMPVVKTNFSPSTSPTESPQASSHAMEISDKTLNEIENEAIERFKINGANTSYVFGRSSVESAIKALRNGELVLVVDDESRENEGDLFLAAELATAANVGFIVRHSSGVLCVSMESHRLEELQLPPMVVNNQDPKQTAYTVSVDCKHNTTTGISSADRATTFRALADPKSQPTDFQRPGHVFPLRYRKGGVLVRGGHTEASVDLMILAGLHRAAVLAEVVNDDGSVMRLEGLREFASNHDIVLTSVQDIIAYRIENRENSYAVASTRSNDSSSPST